MQTEKSQSSGQRIRLVSVIIRLPSRFASEADDRERCGTVRRHVACCVMPSDDISVHTSISLEIFSVLTATNNETQLLLFQKPVKTCVDFSRLAPFCDNALTRETLHSVEFLFAYL